MTWTAYRPSKWTVFILLMVLSGLNLRYGRPSWTNHLKPVLQVLAWGQDMGYSAAYRTLVGAEAVSQSQLDETARQQQALEHMIFSQQARIAELEAELDALRALRDAGIPMYLPLLRVRVVARDMVASRDTLLVNRGSWDASARPHVKDWVASRLFLNAGLTGGLKEGQVVLGHEALIGRVEKVGTFMSRVQLLSDRDSEAFIAVGFGRRENEQLLLADYEGTLTGNGGGEMVVRMVAERFVHQDGDMIEDPAESARRIQIGDQVFTRPNQLGIPVPLVIGRVDRFVPDMEHRLVVNVIVRPVVALDDLKEVFVIPAIPSGPVPLGK